MPTDREVMQQALDALEEAHPIMDIDAMTRQEEAIDALRTQLAKPDVPDGWKLVPVEPNAEMMKEFWDVYEGDTFSITRAWRKMFNAAPQPESGE